MASLCNSMHLFCPISNPKIFGILSHHLSLKLDWDFLYKQRLAYQKVQSELLYFLFRDEFSRIQVWLHIQSQGSQIESGIYPALPRFF